jgi:hypothetical protein
VQGPHSVSDWERVGVVVWVFLWDCCLACFQELDSGVFAVQPTSLHVRLFLWVVFLRVNFSVQVRDLSHLLVFEGSVVTTSLLLRLLVVFLGKLFGRGSHVLSIGSLIGSLPVSHVVVFSKSINDGSEPSGCTIDWSVDEGQLSDVVFVDHR